MATEPTIEGPRGDAARGRALHGARGLAACGVVLLHAGLYSGTFTSLGQRLEVWRHLNSAVPVFFVLSGFLLYSPFAAAHADGHAAPRFVAYAARRALRIFPGYWAVLIVSMFVFSALGVASGSPHHPDTVLGGVSWFGLFAQWGHMADRAARTVPQAWTLDVEIAFYLALPLVAAGVGILGARLRKSWMTCELLGIGAFAAISIAVKLVGAAHSGNVTTSVTYIGWPISYFDGFAIGMLLAVIALHRDRGGRLPRGVEFALQPLVIWLTWAALLVGTVVLLKARNGNDVQEIWTGKRFLAEYVAYIGLGALLVAPVVLGGRGTGVVRGLLSHRLINWVGTISYGIYLWHFFVLDLLKELGLHAAGGLSAYAVWCAAGLAGTAAIAAVSWKIVEQPALRLKRHFPLGERSTAPALGAPLPSA